MQPPIDPTVVAPFLVAVALMELTPGPNMGWLALVSLSQGRAAGLAAVVGITLGLTLWMVAAAFGLTEVVLRWPALYQAIRWAGVGFLLWLAWDAWRSAGDGAGVAPVAMRRRALFRRGLIGNLLNPKAALLYVVLLPGFMRPDHGSNSGAGPDARRAARSGQRRRPHDHRADGGARGRRPVDPRPGSDAARRHGPGPGRHRRLDRLGDASLSGSERKARRMEP
ncbi:LysE family translocator [Brevundimonas diminuta]|uniref:LysE family translocator n=1 Tax=Brevundimonas diminuta TaxID=293 RepID=UPI003D9A1E73